MAGAKRRRSSPAIRSVDDVGNIRYELVCSTVIELKPGITVTITMTRLSELDLQITSKR
jgi:hypothetical protein